AERRRLMDAAFLHQLQPVGDVVVDGAFGFAVRIAAVEAAPGLVRGPGLAEAAVQLVEAARHALRQRNLRRHLARGVEELEEMLLAHGVVSGVSGEKREVRERRAVSCFRSLLTSLRSLLITPPSAVRSPAPPNSPPSA